MVGRIIAVFVGLLIILFVIFGPIVADAMASSTCGFLESVGC